MKPATHVFWCCVTACLGAGPFIPVEASDAACAEANPFQSVGEGVESMSFA